MSRVSAIPGWWLTLKGARSRSDLLDLLAAVERAGVAKNDRTAVMDLWTERQIAMARLPLVQEMTMRESLERDDAA